MQGKTIVVTGGLGALGGIVAEIAAKRGAAVALLDHAQAVPQGFAERLGANTLLVGGVDLTPIGGQNGLFSIIPFTADQIAAIRAKHGVYFAGSGRINVAGLTTGNIDTFLSAVADVTA